MTAPYIVKHTLMTNPAIPVLAVYLSGMKTHILATKYVYYSYSASFTVAPHGKKPQSPAIGGGVNKLWHTQTNSAIKNEQNINPDTDVNESQKPPISDIHSKVLRSERIPAKPGV